MRERSLKDRIGESAGLILLLLISATNGILSIYGTIILLQHLWFVPGFVGAIVWIAVNIFLIVLSYSLLIKYSSREA